MVLDIYKKVAEKLDAMPTGFPATESGVEGGVAGFLSQQFKALF